MIAAAATKGRLKIENVIPKHLESITAKLCEMQLDVEEDDDFVIVSYNGKLTNVNVKTQPYPGFPTDLHPQAATVLSLASGESMIRETVFPRRFQYVLPLSEFGASLQNEGAVLKIRGIEKLHEANVASPDLRGGAALLLAALAADGASELRGTAQLARGYASLVPRLCSLGALISDGDAAASASHLPSDLRE